jgi:hypothetical protein
MTQPTNADIQYCLEHREWLAALLEKRGGWTRFDIGAQELGERYVLQSYMPSTSDSKELAYFQRYFSDLVWLPSEGDALAMLVDAGIQSVQLDKAIAKGGATMWFATAHVLDGIPLESDGGTLAIALLELLRSCEEEQ